MAGSLYPCIGTVFGTTSWGMSNVTGVVPRGHSFDPWFRCSRITRKGSYGFEKRKKKSKGVEYTIGDYHGSTRTWSTSSRGRNV